MRLYEMKKGRERCLSEKGCVWLAAVMTKRRTGHSSLGRGRQQRSVSIRPLHGFRSMTRGSASFLTGGPPGG